jgi:acyl transferase domain-containing protein
VDRGPFAGIRRPPPGRIANRRIRRTNYIVDAACASSLAAIAHAVQLQTGRATGADRGSTISRSIPVLLQTQVPRERTLSAFDAEADTAISEGFATIVLKRLADAERDGDRIYAVIKGVGSASDGWRSLTAPRRRATRAPPGLCARRFPRPSASSGPWHRHGRQ